MSAPLPSSLLLTPSGRWPTRLVEATVAAVMARELPAPQPCGSTPQWPRASIIVATHNGLVYTRMCLESLMAQEALRHDEIIVVDNGSTDGTPDYLLALAARWPNLRVVCNPVNRGFAPANNQGMALARGALLVLLNNDTLPPPGWLDGLTRYLCRPQVGMVGPVTNATSNEARIDTSYRSYGDMLVAASARARDFAGMAFDIPMLAMYCVALRREVCERVGGLDERFAIGMFEDDDYALRVQEAGYRVVCAEDVFVHHFGQATIGDLDGLPFQGLFEANRLLWEQKWGRPWTTPRRRHSPAYGEVIRRLRDAIDLLLPPAATVLVVSKGDPSLLELGGRRAWHFPQSDDGSFSGYYPADSAEAISGLERLRGRGANFLLFPAAGLWWLEHYAEFHQYLERRYRFVMRQDDLGALVALS